MESAWLYRVVAGAESDDAKAGLFNELANVAERQARILEREFGAAGPTYTPSLRARVVGVLVKAFGPRRVGPLLAAMKVRGLSVYSALAPLPDHPRPASVAEIGHRHTQGATAANLRAAVFGINDGLVSNTSLILGVAGATSDSAVILAAGVAGLVAGAFSMAGGEYVSVRSQRELYEYQIAQERSELDHYPEEEAEELALIYSARGIELEKAREMTASLFKDPEQALDSLAIEELGVNPKQLGSPWAAALSSFLSFAAGAALPLLPFAIVPAESAMTAVLMVSATGLFAVGATVSLFSGRGALKGGLRMLAIGAAAGLVTYSIGRALGVGLD